MVAFYFYEAPNRLCDYDAQKLPSVLTSRELPFLCRSCSGTVDRRIAMTTIIWTELALCILLSSAIIGQTVSCRAKLKQQKVVARRTRRT